MKQPKKNKYNGKDKTKILFDAVSKEYDLGTLKDFRLKLQNPAKRKAFYKQVGKEYNLGSFEEFEAKVTIKKKVSSTSTAQKPNSESVGEVENTSLATKGKTRSSTNKETHQKPTLPELIKRRDQAVLESNWANKTYENVQKFNQATSISDNEKQEAIKRAKEKLSGDTFAQKLNKYGTKTANFLNNLITLGIADNLKHTSYKDEITQKAKKQLKEKKTEITPEILENKVFEIALNEQLENLEDKKKVEYLENLSDEDKKSLKINQILQNRHASLKEKAEELTLKILSAKSTAITEKIKALDTKIKSEKTRIESLVEQGQDIPSEVIEKYNEMVSLQKEKIEGANEYIKEYKKHYESLTESVSKQMNNSEKLDFIRREYGFWENMENIVLTSTGDVGAGFIGAAAWIKNIQGASKEGLYKLTGGKGNITTVEEIEALKLTKKAQSIKEEMNEWRGDFRPNMEYTSISSISDLGYFMAQETAKQVPVIATIAIPYVGLSAIGVSSGGNKFSKMKAKEIKSGDFGKYSLFQEIIVPSIYGGAELIGEGVTKRILTRAVTSKAEKELLEKGIKQYFKKGLKATGSFTKDNLEEAAGELFTETMQFGADRYILGDKQRSFEGMKAVISSFGASPVMTATANLTGKIIKPFVKADDLTRMQDKAVELANLKQAIDEASNEDTKQLLLSKYKTKQQEAINLTDKVLKDLSNIDKARYNQIISISTEQQELRSQAEKILKDKGISDDQKKKAIKELDSQFNLLETKRNRINSGKFLLSDVLSEKEYFDLTKRAGDILIQEAKSKGLSSIELSNEDIEKKAIELYNSGNKNTSSQSNITDETPAENKPESRVKTQVQENIDELEKQREQAIINLKKEQVKAEENGEEFDYEDQFQGINNQFDEYKKEAENPEFYGLSEEEFDKRLNEARKAIHKENGTSEETYIYYDEAVNKAIEIFNNEQSEKTKKADGKDTNASTNNKEQNLEVKQKIEELEQNREVDLLALKKKEVQAEENGESLDITDEQKKINDKYDTKIKEVKDGLETESKTTKTVPSETNIPADKPSIIDDATPNDASIESQNEENPENKVVKTKEVKYEKGTFRVETYEDGKKRIFGKNDREIKRFTTRKDKKTGKEKVIKNPQYSKIEAISEGGITENQSKTERNKALNHALKNFEPYDAYSAALYYLASGGTMMAKDFGVKKGAASHTGLSKKEVKWVTKDKKFKKESELPSLEAASENAVADAENEIDVEEVRNELIELIKSNENRTSIQDALIELVGEEEGKLEQQELDAYLNTLSEKELDLYLAIKTEEDYLSELTKDEKTAYYTQKLEEHEEGNRQTIEQQELEARNPQGANKAGESDALGGVEKNDAEEAKERGADRERARPIESDDAKKEKSPEQQELDRKTAETDQTGGIDFNEDTPDDVVPFQQGEDNFTPITSVQFKKLIDRLKKAFPIFNKKGMLGTTESDLRDILKKNGIAWGNFQRGIVNAKLLSVFHGSPHSFKSFSSDKIGSGEGAQAFGWGLYFTDLIDIAKGYANQSSSRLNVYLSKFDKAIDNGQEISFKSNDGDVSIITKNENGTYNIEVSDGSNTFSMHQGVSSEHITETFISFNHNTFGDGQYSIDGKNIKGLSSNLYKAKIHGDKAINELNFLEWDKTVTKDQIDKINKQIEAINNNGLFESWGYREEMDGEQVYIALTDYFFQKGESFLNAQKRASLFLLQAGIDGVKYPTESISKGANSDNARGSNYVVFDEKAVEIEEHIQYLKTENGEVYGAVFPNGQMWIDGNKTNANTPIHEFGHVWTNVLKKQFPNAHKKLINKAKADKKAMDQVRRNPNYASLTDDQIADEVIARFIGDIGEQRFLKEEGLSDKEKSIRQRLYDAILKAWEGIKKHLSKTDPNIRKWTDKQWEKATLADVADAVSGELLSGKNISNENIASKTDEVLLKAERESENIQLEYDSQGRHLAPNGKPSNLTEQQAKIVRTKAFKNWFGDWETEADILHLYDKNKIDYEKLKNVARRIQTERTRTNGGVATLSQEKRIESSRNVEASLVARAKRKAERQNKIRYAARTWAEHKENVKGQEQALEEYAKKEGIWFDDFTVFEYEYGVFDQGMESEVWYDKDSDTHLIKTFGYDFVKQIDPYTAIKNRVELHNQLFPSTAYEIIGFTKDLQGNFKFVLKQPFIKGDVVSRTDLIAFMKKKYDAVPVNEEATEFRNSIFTFKDLHSGNVIKDGNIIHVIDPQISINENVEIENNVSKIVDANGEPMVVYHGTKKEFNVFGREQKPLSNAHRLWYFTPNKKMADTFGSKYGGRTIEVFLNIKNPKTNVENDAIEDIGYWATDQQLNEFEKKGFDGIIEKGGEQIIVTNSPNQIKLADGSNNTFNTNNNDIRFQIVGEKASLEEQHRANLELAREMEQDGLGNKEIFLATGWERGADNKWRMEINDAQMTFKEDATLMQGYNLDEAINYPDLFKMYPEIRNVRISFRDKLGNMNGAYIPQKNIVLINSDRSIEDMRSTLLHEIQHIIQRQEGFSTGGTPQAAKAYLKRKIKKISIAKNIPSSIINAAKKVGINIAKGVNTRKSSQELAQEIRENKSRLSKDEFDLYLSIAGEVESRNVQSRMNMSDSERASTPISETEDVARESQLPLGIENTKENKSLKRAPKHDSTLSEDGLVKDLSKRKKWAKRVWHRTFYSSAGAPKEIGEVVRSLGRERSAYTTALEYEMSLMNKLIKKAKKQSGKSEIEVKKIINNYITGNVSDISFLNEEQKDQLRYLRARVDVLSDKLIDNLKNKLYEKEELLEELNEDSIGFTPLSESIDRIERLIDTIEKNKGHYLTRSYKIFSDKKYLDGLTSKTPSPAAKRKIDNAVKYIVDNSSDLLGTNITEEDARQQIYAYLDGLKGKDDFVSATMDGKARAPFLKKKKDIPEPIRELLGEVKDPVINYANTVFKVSDYIASLEYQDRMIKQLKAFGLTGQAQAGYTALSSNGEGWDVFAGVYVPEGLKQAIDDIQPLEQVNSWAYRTWIKLAAYVKYGKTVLSPTTTARNILSGTLLAFNAGFAFFGKPKVIKDAFVFSFEGGMSDSKKRKEILKLIKLGVVKDGSMSGEILSTMNDLSTASERVTSKRVTEKLLDPFRKLYAFGDDFYKIIGYYTYKERYMKHGLSEHEAELKAAERISNAFPTYSKLPKTFQHLRRFGVTGSFVSFPYEVWRTTGNNIKYIAEDFKEGRSDMAWKQIAGMVIAKGSATGLAAYMAAMIGIDDEDDDFIRESAAPWQKNSLLIYTGKEKGEAVFSDASAFFPSEIISTPIRTLIEQRHGRDFVDKLGEASWETLEPFLGMDISFEAATDLINNTDTYGRKIYKGETIYEGIIKSPGKVAAYILEKAGPGVYNNIKEFARAKNIAPGFFGDKITSYGREYNTRDALLALFGFRFSTIKFNSMMTSRGYDEKGKMRQARTDLTNKLETTRRLTNEDIQDIIVDYNKMNAETSNALIHGIGMARKLDVTERNIFKSIKQSGYSEKDIKAMMHGLNPMLKPISKSSIEREETRLRLNISDTKKRKEAISNFKSNIRRFNKEIRMLNSNR